MTRLIALIGAFVSLAVCGIARAERRRERELVRAVEIAQRDSRRRMFWTGVARNAEWQ